MNTIDEVVELPCGYITQEGDLYTHARVREMLGSEEDLLSNRKKMLSGDAIEEVLAACTTLVFHKESGEATAELEVDKDMVRGMTQGDRMLLLLTLRRVTYGNVYQFAIKCPYCTKKNDVEVDLSTLDLVPMKDRRLRVYDVTLPRSGDVIKFKITTGHEERKMQRMLEQNKDSDATINMACRLVSVNDETVSPIKYLKTLTVPDRTAYRKAIKDAEGGVNTELQGLECTSCQSDLSMEIPLTESFFLPTSE